ncbi:response regulator [Ideonella sp. DXS22W]|uniref:Response regulator n=1 Tax=Pseudaquabacterium inlustre TaxID=2984192 RepID=A0ABU9CJ49_9BURK
MTLRVLLVEDDRALRATLRAALAVEGYEVLTAASLSEGLAVVAHAARPGEASPGLDLVLLDLGLPDGDGDTLLQSLRKRHGLPVLVISAREAEGQKIRLLDAGADDYLVKPFGMAELLARMRVALRHRGTALAPAITRWQHEGVCVDLADPRVLRDGQPVHLTPTEFKLLARLVRSAGRIVTHRQLLADVWGAEYVDHTHYLRLYMGQLRAKLEAVPAEPRLLLTEPGMGYRLVEGA